MTDRRQERWDAERAEAKTLDKDQYVNRRRRSLITGAGSMLLGYGGWSWLHGRPTADGIPGPLRAGFEFNEALWTGISSETREVPTFDESDLTGIRMNGRIGLRSELDREAWRLNVVGPGGETIEEMDEATLLAMPEKDMIVEHKCVEGWSAIVRWTGPTVADLVARYDSALSGDWDYVSFETPDQEYYVGLDRAAALHPQTVLATQLDGEPLELGHGAPVRLAVPIAYGIKSLKRIGTIRFTNVRPADYWGERGYDWYSLH